LSLLPEFDKVLLADPFSRYNRSFASCIFNEAK